MLGYRVSKGFFVNFQVGSALARKARIMHDYMVETRNNKSIQEIKEFVAKLPQMLANKQSLATHTTIAEYIKEVTYQSQLMELSNSF